MDEVARGEGPELKPVRCGGVTLATRRLGPTSAGVGRPVLVALHGGPGLDHHVLLPLARRLAGRFEVWLPDLPGHGASTPPSGRLPGLEGLVEQTASWLARLPGGVDALLGHSLGAWLVRELLRRRRVAPRAAILLSPPAAGRRGLASAWQRAVRLAEPTLPVTGLADEARAHQEFLAHLDAESRGRSSPELTAAMAGARLRPSRAYGALLRNLHRALAGPMRGFDPGCSVLVLCGEEDRTTPPHEAARVASSTAGARLEIVPGGGHYLCGERPAATAESIVRFLTEALRAPAAGR